MAKKYYDPEFKKQIIKLSNERGNMLSIAREFDVPYTTINRWCRSKAANAEDSFSAPALASTDEQSNIKEFRNLLENNDLNLEILMFILRNILS